MSEINRFTLRRLYNSGHVGRGEAGITRRKEFKVTLRPVTIMALQETVPIGHGQYGSPFVELSLRTLLSAVNQSISMEQVAEELAAASLQPFELANNLSRLSSLVARAADNAARHPSDE